MATVDQNIRELIRQPESTTLELKTNTPDVGTLLKVLSSFANTEGGVLVVGVREGGEVVGADMPRLMRAVEEARRLLKPPQLINADVATIDGKQFGIVRIGKSAIAPVFADAGVYIRHGETTQPMTAEALVQRVQQGSVQPDVATLLRAIAGQTLLIEGLGDQLSEAQGWKSKFKDWFIGGIIGAILGALASLVIK